MQKRSGWFLIATGFLACPCHLVVTLPLALALLSGTAVGAFLAQNEGLVFGVAFIYFLAALGMGFFLMNFKSRAAAEVCSECKPETQETLAQSVPTRRESSPLIIGGRGSSRR